MHFKQFYVGCLAHASYLIGDDGEAAVVDPSRDDRQMYLEEAERARPHDHAGCSETHLHADFVSGHRELAARTGATIAHRRARRGGYPHRRAAEGDEIRDRRRAGCARSRRPGHTPESLSFLVFEHAGDAKPWAVLTGDTLFVGDVGRVDILSSRLPVAELAGLMYDSLHGKLLTLPDETRGLPGARRGLACAGATSARTPGARSAASAMMNAGAHADEPRGSSSPR